MLTAESSTIAIEASDVSGQKTALAPKVPLGMLVGDLLLDFIRHLNLPRNGSEGEPILYQGHLVREGRHLRNSESIGEALREGDKIVLQPNIDAGSPAGLRRPR